MLSKIIELEPHFPTGETTVQPVVLWVNGRPCYEQLTKHASVGADFFKSINPIPGHSIVYVLALGAWESYGENRNGDGFPEFPYMETASPPAITQKDVLPQHYKSFETHGYNYRHHQNKDPKKAVGRVMKAFWNPSMHRVELLIDLDNAKAPDLAERIAAGEYPPVSMGTRVKYDVCSICLNRAPTRAHYCDHLKFQMRDVIEGKKIAALNPSPNFFDISWVFRPADATAFMLKKVAEPMPYELLSGAAAGEYLDMMEAQKMAAHKMAVLDKVVQGYPVDAKTESVDPVELDTVKKMRPLAMEAGKNTEELPEDLVRTLSKHSFPKVASSLLAAGMIQLSTPEIIKFAYYQHFPTERIPEDFLKKAVALQGSVLGFFEEHPQVLDKLAESGVLNLGPEYVDPSLISLVTPYIEKRAGIGEYLKRRLVPDNYRQETPYSTQLSLTDPVTRQRYATTRGAAIRAHDEIAKRNIYKVLGGGALLGGAYKLIGNSLTHHGMGKFKPLAALGLGALGASRLPSMGKHYMTDQGIPIPTLTELAKVSSVKSITSLGVPVFGTLGVMAALAHDYQSRLRSGIPLGYEHLPLSRKVLDSVSEFSQEHPIITGVGGVIGLNRLGQTSGAQALARALGRVATPAKQTIQGAANTAKQTLKGLTQNIKVSAYVAKNISPLTSTVLLPEVDLDKIAEWIGWMIVEG